MNFFDGGYSSVSLENRTVRYACSFYVIRFSLPCGKDTENLPAGKSGLIKKYVSLQENCKKADC